ncbi:ATP synthase mitochondrial F1 complex assembly factor 2-like [Acanthaster planci]|uniref:ATP synthase mitochondrial F1 complex assembly factor 2-like n=1 Tax=Acanthaster planci TaxID=133434 RepID=A0A8B7YH53_ACAPL|nr:ATP synthase mitochondrial F1 complex assembly factor 2-like [Acanthaster planci]
MTTTTSVLLSRCESLRRILQKSVQPVYMNNLKRLYRERKRFYQNVSISHSGRYFEVNLDRRKVKTPAGQLLTVPNEPLAIAVATEWDNQGVEIKQHTMHLTTLCNTAIDNPSGRNKEQVVRAILHFLDTDTICYRLRDPPELFALQTNEWDPLLEWINARYKVEVSSSTSIAGPQIPEATKETLRHHLETHSDWALIGYENMVSSLKSLVLTFALMDRRLSVEEAVKLSLLETEFQIARWGSVEWAHDTENADLKARVAAAALFTQLVSGSHEVKQKQPVQY